jgi:V-type H+-transporting ATPase subunit C
LTQTTPKSSKKAKANLDNAFSYLGGNAIARDKKGKAVKEDGLAHDMGAAGVAGDPNEYTPYVYYEFSIE